MHTLHYFNHIIKREISELYIATVIMGFAMGMLGLFTPLYFFKLGYSIQEILLFFVIIYVIFFLIAPIGAKLTVRLGHERTMALANPFIILYFTLLYYLPTSPSFFWIAALSWGLYKGIFWVAYHSDFARFGNKKSIGEEIGFVQVLAGVVGVVAPALGGMFVETWGFPLLFVTGAFLMIASLIPMLMTKEEWQPGKTSVKRIHKMLTAPRMRKDMIAAMGAGEGIIATVLWPLWLFMIIPSYRDVGVLTTITVFITFIMFLWIGKLSNKRKKSYLIKRTSSLLSLSWIARMLAFTPLTVFFSDALYRISAKSVSIPIVALAYTRPGRRQTIEYTAFWMSSLAMGKALAAFSAWALFFFTNNLVYGFLLAALFALLYFFWSDASSG